MINNGELMKQEISDLKDKNLKYEEDIKMLEKNNSDMKREISSLKGDIKNLNKDN